MIFHPFIFYELMAENYVASCLEINGDYVIAGFKFFLWLLSVSKEFSAYSMLMSLLILSAKLIQKKKLQYNHYVIDAA